MVVTLLDNDSKELTGLVFRGGGFPANGQCVYLDLFRGSCAMKMIKRRGKVRGRSDCSRFELLERDSLLVPGLVFIFILCCLRYFLSNESHRIKGWVWFYEGEDVDAELKRLSRTHSLPMPGEVSP